MNPSELLVRSLEGRVIAGRVVDVRVLPVETRTLRNHLEAALRQQPYEFAIGTGFAPGRISLALERAALNVLDFELPDAVGTMRKNDPVQRGGPDARLATLPLGEIVDAWRALGIPGYVSNTAGTYLCNQWLYEALAITANASPPIPAGFLHLPALPAQAAELGAERTPSMALDLMRRGVETLIETVAGWLESLPATVQQRAAGQMWIPRGLREVER
ncbi:pyrrolidone-carboxylate peptidase [Vulcanimicrobium alpinum]|uniref:Pyroglutamyl-peptidase I n=2 Tax=Vulcanimicrobium alpinum TaxID=3016050 RepID=A0AAN2C968_UNVUL|nr:pyrrolidone-carboxylate peptidase [Vulcanimicrobium alpinum]